MKVIQTRYRDIPFEELPHPLQFADSRIATAEDWAKVRGTVRLIKSGPLSKEDLDLFNCDGPFYEVKGCGVALCPHIAEIGD